MSEQKNDAGSEFGWVVVGVAVVAALAYAVLRLLADVLSLRGVMYSFGFGPGDGLMWPEVTRVVTWLLAVELCAAAGMIGNYIDGRWKDWWGHNLILGHVKFGGWLFRGARAV